jgi:hypothetical protein
MWALLVVLHPPLLMYVARLGGHPAGLESFLVGLRQYLVLAYMVVLAFWAGDRLQREVGAAAPAVARLAGGDTPSSGPSAASAAWRWQRP